MANKKTPSRRPQNRSQRRTPGKSQSRTPKKKGLRINKEYSNLILIFLGLFMWYGLSSSSNAIVPNIVKTIFKGGFGGLAILAPIALIVKGVIGFLEGNEKIDKIKENKLLYVIFILLLIYYGLINYAQSPVSSPLEKGVIQDIIKVSVNRRGIGLIPSFITYYLTHFVGFVGAWLISFFVTIILILYVFNISIDDLLQLAKNPEDGRKNIFSKFSFRKKKNSDGDDIDDATILNKTGFFEKIRDKFSKDGENTDDVDDTDKTIKIVGFNKAEDDYLEILEGTQTLSDMEILQKLQNEEPVIDGLVSGTTHSDGNDMEATMISAPLNSNRNNVDDSTASALADKKPNLPMKDGAKSGNIDQNLVSEINEHEKYKNYTKPPISLLNKVQSKADRKSKQKVLENARQLEQTLRDFGVEASINQVTVGPTITRYEIQPKPGVKVSKIVNLTDDIALSLAAKSIRMEAPIPGKSAIGIEVPNDTPQMVSIREVMESKEFNSFPSTLAFGLGKDVSGRTIIGNIASMPHVLIAGSTGSGKSVCVNTLITSIIYKAKPDEVKLMLIDPKVVELANYNGIPHLLIPVVTDPKKAANALGWAVNEMNRRYSLFADAQVKDITSYNDKTDNPLPKIVIIIDELADLMMVSANDVEDYICRLAQMARAAGMHLVVATQRPSVDVITGVIKSNIPSRIAFAVSSQIDSRTIIDMSGAEKLLGKGDMLYYPLGAAKPVRIQGAFISEEESEKIIDYVKKEAGNITYSNDIEESITNINTEKSDDTDEFLYDAIDFVVSNGQASASMLQRKFKIGFNRAARLIDDMEDRGIVGPSEGSRPRKVLISKEDLEGLS